MVGRHIGQYRVLDRIGHGGMGTVYRAIDETLEREVALKALDSEPEDAQKRFRAEAVALARLSHPGIATVYELFQHEDRWIMVMELVRGQTLQQIVEQMGVFSPQRAAEYCMQALGALAHAHSAGVVHRDLKPSNLMITETGAVKIMDFGIARLDGSVHLTNAGFMMGTPAYMAPEQVQGHDIDARVDLYAMGVVFYRLISAELPFQGDTALAMALSQMNDAPTPIDLVRSDLPSWVHRIVARALAKSPDQRFQSALEFHEGFARCLAGLPLSSAGTLTEVSVRPSSGLLANSTTSPTPWSLSAPRGYLKNDVAARRRRVVAWTGIAAAGLCIGAIGASVGLRLLPDSPLPNGARAQTRAVDTRLAMDIPLAVDTPDVVVTPAAAITKRAAAVESKLTPTVQTGAMGATSAMSREEGASNAAPASATFSNVKLLIVNGGRTTERDVLLTFWDGQIIAVLNGGGAALATVPYRRIAKATYVRAQDPQWDPLLSSPTERINVPGFLGRSRHWLVVQTKDTYAILRLDEGHWPDVLNTFEVRTGVTIHRPLATGD